MGLQHLHLQMPRELIARRSRKSRKGLSEWERQPQTLCEKYHLRSPELVNRWVKSYNGHKDSKKISGGFFMTKRKSAIDERLAAVKEYTEAGKPYEQIARERGFSYRQVYEWVRKYRKFGIAGLEDRRGERKISQTPVPRKKNLKSVWRNWNMKIIC